MTDRKLLHFNDEGWPTEHTHAEDGHAFEPLWQCPSGCCWNGQPVRYAGWPRPQCRDCGAWCQRIYLGDDGHVALAGEPPKEGWDG